MVKGRMRLVFGASLIATSLALAGVAVATGPTGSVVAEVIGAGSMSHGAGFTATPGTNTVVADFTVSPDFVPPAGTRTLVASAVTVKSGTFTVYHARDCGADGLSARGRVHRAAVDGSARRSEQTGSDVELGVVFFGVPIGGSPRIDQPRAGGLRDHVVPPRRCQRPASERLASAETLARSERLGGSSTDTWSPPLPRHGRR